MRRLNGSLTLLVGLLGLPVVWGCAATPPTGVTLTPAPSSPQPAGTPVVWTATATGGTAPQFRYWVLPQGGAWTVGQGYSGSPTFPWTPSSTGTYMVCVWARSGSSTADRDADRCLAYTVTPPPGGGTSLSRRATSS